MGLFDLFAGSNTLYYPGCVLFHKYKEYFELYQEVLVKLGVKFNIFDSYVCCGIEALEAGYEKEARKLARRNFEIFKNNKIEEIITTSPECYKMFVQDYPEILFDWNIQVSNIWDLIAENLEKKPWLIKTKPFETVTFHDNCYLGRGCWIFNSPRRILELLGYHIKEMEDYKENSLCCGSCGGLSRVNPELSGKMARERLLQAKRIGVKKMIVLGFDNYSLLKKNSGGLGVEVFELSEVLADALGIIKIKRDYIEEEKVEGEDEILTEEKEENILAEANANRKMREELKEEDVYDKFEEDEW